jgi:hypothetical protein
MHLVLDEEVDQGYQRREECTAQILSQLDCPRVRRAEQDTSDCPRQRRNQIADHEDVVVIVIVRTRHICPAATRQCSEHAHSGNPLSATLAFAIGHAEPKETEQEPWARAGGDEELENTSFGVAVADCRRDRRKPFNRIAVVFILDNLVIMKGNADDEGANEGRVGGDGVSVGDPLRGDLSLSV